MVGGRHGLHGTLVLRAVVTAPNTEYGAVIIPNQVTADALVRARN